MATTGTPWTRSAAARLAQRLGAWLCVAAVAWLPLCAAGAPVLRVLSWPGYADADVVAAFEKRHAVRVEITTVGSDDSLRAKLADPAGPGYDVVAANTVEIASLVAQKRLIPLPMKDIANAGRQLPRFRQLASIPGITSEGAVYALPYTYSEMGLIYDRRQFSVPPDSLNVLWDPRWQGRVLVFHGSSHNFSLAAQHRGLAPFRIDAARFGGLARDLVALRRNVLSFYSVPEESVELFRRHRIAVMHANYGQQQLKLLRDAGLDVGYVIPQEGALAWLDCWAITRRSAQPALAARWIDYMLEPAVSGVLTRRQGLANTLQEPPGGAAGAAASPMVWLEPVENEEQRTRVWRRIVSGERPEGF